MKYNLTKSEWNNLSAEQKAEYLQKLTEQFKGLQETINRARLNSARLAKSINKHNLYRNYWDATEKTSKSSYLEQAGIPIDLKEFNELCTTYDLLEQGVPEEGIIQLGKYKKNLLHSLGDELNGEWVEKALNLSSGDLKKEIDQHKGKYKKSETECDHHDLKHEEKWICEECGAIFNHKPTNHKCDD